MRSRLRVVAGATFALLAVLATLYGLSYAFGDRKVQALDVAESAAPSEDVTVSLDACEEAGDVVTVRGSATAAAGSPVTEAVVVVEITSGEGGPLAHAVTHVDLRSSAGPVSWSAAIAVPGGVPDGAHCDYLGALTRS